LPKAQFTEVRFNFGAQLAQMSLAGIAALIIAPPIPIPTCAHATPPRSPLVMQRRSFFWRLHIEIVFVGDIGAATVFAQFAQEAGKYGIITVIQQVSSKPG
jgi:hypothetical protein